MHMASTRQNGHMAYSDTQILGSVPNKKNIGSQKASVSHDLFDAFLYKVGPKSSCKWSCETPMDVPYKTT